MNGGDRTREEHTFWVLKKRGPDRGRKHVLETEEKYPAEVLGIRTSDLDTLEMQQKRSTRADPTT